MILLLLTSALALSFVPLKSNEVGNIIVGVGTVTYDPEETELTIPLTAGAALDGEANSFELAIFETADGEDEVGVRVDIKTLLDDDQPHDATFTFDFSTINADLGAVYIDIIETDTEATPNVRSMLEDGERIPVAFRKAESIAFVEDPDVDTKVKITVTLDAGLPEDLTGITLEFLTESLTLTKAADMQYSASILKSAILAADSLVGYFKGTNLATSSLPFTILEDTPTAPAIKLLSATHAQFEYTVPTGAKLMIHPTAGDETEVTKPSGEDYYTVAYADIAVASKIYYAKAAGAPISKALDLPALPALTAPTLAWEAVAGAGELPKLVVTFAGTGTKRQLVIRKPAETLVGLDAAETKLTPAQIEGSAAYFIVADSTSKVPETLPSVLPQATIAAAKGAVEDAKIPVTVTMTTGTYAKQPKGIVVYSKGETDKTKAKYYPLTWSDTTANTATYQVPEAELPTSTRKDVECYVSEDCTTMPEIAAIVKLSPVLVLRAGVAPTVTVSAFQFVPAGLKLTVPFKSSEDLTSDVDTEYGLFIYTEAEEGAPIYATLIKALLDGTDKTVVVDLDAAEFANRKTLYVDIMQFDGQVLLSIIAGGERKPATFAATASAVTVAKDTDTTKLLITFTLSDDLPEHATAKFVLSGEHDVAKAASPEKTYTVTMPAADFLAVPTNVGYFKGADMAKSTLPIVLFEDSPDIVLEHVDATDVHAKPLTAVGTKKVWFKSGEAAPVELTVVTGQTYYNIEYAKLSGVAYLYYTDATGLIVTNKLNLTLNAFTAPEYEWVLVTEGDNKTPKIKLVFEEENANRALVIPGTPDVIVTLEEEETTFELANLVQTGAYYISLHSDAPLTLPLAVPAATLVQSKTAEASGKVPVTVTVEAGLLTAVPTGILVHAEGETDLTKAKYYALTWGTTEATVNKATAQVTVADFAELTAKNIESYVANKVGDAAATKITAAEKIVVIPKKEDPGKDEGAFGQMVSIMAVLLSLFVFAL